MTYGFLTKWAEPAALFRWVSERFPSLVFVLGGVAPATEAAESWYFRAGRQRSWRMGVRAQATLRREIYKQTGEIPGNVDDDTEFWLDIEFAHALVRSLVDHWTGARRRQARVRRQR